MLVKATAPILLLAGLASAAPLDLRAEGNVTCSTGFATATNRPLHWATTDGMNGLYIVQTGGKDTLIKAANEAAQRIAEEDFAFSFQSCNSTYMGFTEHQTPAQATVFGHIVVTKSGLNEHLVGKCLAVRKNVYPLAAGTTKLHIEDCSSTDDSTQLSQYWQLQHDTYVYENPSDGLQKRANVAFVGVRRAMNGKHGDEAPPVYRYDLEDDGLGAAKAVAVEKLSGEEYIPKIYFNTNLG